MYNNKLIMGNTITKNLNYYLNYYTMECHRADLEWRQGRPRRPASSHSDGGECIMAHLATITHYSSVALIEGLYIVCDSIKGVITIVDNSINSIKGVITIVDNSIKGVITIVDNSIKGVFTGYRELVEKCSAYKFTCPSYPLVENIVNNGVIYPCQVVVLLPKVIYEVSTIAGTLVYDGSIHAYETIIKYPEETVDSLAVLGCHYYTVFILEVPAFRLGYIGVMGILLMHYWGLKEFFMDQVYNDGRLSRVDMIKWASGPSATNAEAAYKRHCLNVWHNNNSQIINNHVKGSEVPSRPEHVLIGIPSEDHNLECYQKRLEKSERYWGRHEEVERSSLFPTTFDTIIRLKK